MNVVITGAGKGIGFQTALSLAKEEGVRVFALSRNIDGLLEQRNENGRSSLFPLVCDITSDQSVEAAVNEIGESVSGVDLLINNAGLLIKKPFEELAAEDWMNVFNVNVFGAVRVTKRLLGLLRKGSIASEEGVRAHVVNISSIGGIQGSMKFRGLSAYTSSKGAMITWTECISEELKKDGIRVNCLALGSVETEMFSTAFPGYKAALQAEEIGRWIGEFGREGYRYFNGKTLPLSTSTP